MPPPSFERVCEMLATDRGGYTLWVGAGAAKALVPSAPTWSELVDRLRGTEKPPPGWDGMSFARKLEWLASHLGHAAFRRGLRQATVDPLLSGRFDADVARAQAMIGLRAGAIVSFNIESVSASTFASARGGAYRPRPYLARRDQLPLDFATAGGLVSAPVFFPHGLLDVYGQCVITASEYRLHGMSMAVKTAVALCLGGDLVILGMSLSDDYLRRGLLKNRRWFDEVYWVASSFEHAEWARLARVHCIRAEHAEVWAGIRAAHLKYDDGGIRRFAHHSDLDVRAVKAVTMTQAFVRDVPLRFAELASEYVSGPAYKPSDFHRFAEQCIDLGLGVPKGILDDPRLLSDPTRLGRVRVAGTSS